VVVEEWEVQEVHLLVVQEVQEVEQRQMEGMVQIKVEQEIVHQQVLHKVILELL
tara:strand:+ start:161 stop:322 length:162 start_codon:yes stop_codon:yes gene_type:complete